jgi:hypothetical protein
MKYLYKYPQAQFPYEQLKEESRNRSREVSEFELMDTDVFDADRYWDVFVEVRLALMLWMRQHWKTDGRPSTPKTRRMQTPYPSASQRTIADPIPQIFISSLKCSFAIPGHGLRTCPKTSRQ